ncbi:MAG TPA: Uma2 family endonuclease, partial [Vicinamibacteria bacterium]
MKAVILDVSPAVLARRKTTGEDRWDEMWEGVLHMSPAPAYEHQRIIVELLVFLVPLLKRAARGEVVSGINVFRADDNYRIPDLCFVARGREDVLAEDGARGGPDAVVEVRSPGDESYEKFPFYAALGVREVIVIPRDEKKPELYRLAGAQYVAVAPDADGMLRCETMAVRFGHEPGPKPKLVVEDAAL